MSGIRNKAYSGDENETHASAANEKQQEVEVKRHASHGRGCYSAYVNGLSFITRTVNEFFESVARSLVKHPFIWISACTLFIGLCCLGFLRFESETRTEKLYVPKNSQAEKDQGIISQHYPTLKNTRLEEFGFFSKSGGNFMKPKCVQEAKDIITKVFKIPGLGDLCLKKPSYMPRFSQFDNRQDCSTLNPFELVRNTSVPLKEFNDNIKGGTTLMSNGKLPVYNEEEMIAKVTRHNGNITSIGILRIQMYLKNSEKDNEKALKWEKAFIDLIQEEEKKLTCASVLFSAQRSLDDAISESAGGDISLISAAFAIMITFANVMLGKFSNPIRGHSLLAIAGVMSTALGIGAGFGLSLGIGTPFVSIIGILPFLVLSIGIDDMFIIVDEFDKQDDKEDIVERIPLTMRRIGATITMTTLTDITAFAVSVTTDFPAIRYFCTFAAITFTVEFILQVTLFVVFLYFDVLRIKAKRRECLPFCKGEDVSCCLKSIGNENLSNVITRKYAIYLMKLPSKILVLLAAGGLLAFGIVGCFNVSQEFSRNSLVKDGSYLLTYLDRVENDFDKGLPVSVVRIGLVNYADKDVQNQIKQAAPVAAATMFYQSRSISWLEQYQLWSQRNGGVNIEGSNFTKNIRAFLLNPQNIHFSQDVKFNAKGQIEATRTKIFMKPTQKSQFQKDAMLKIREEFKTNGIHFTPYSDNFIYFEQFAAVKGEVTRNICVAAAAVLVITLPFCVKPTIVLSLLFGFASLIAELIGLMYFWDVSLNSISMINLVMSIGFAIDYSAHIAHAYVTSTKSSPNERVIDALESIGASVFMGGASTFLGMLVTAFASSAIFRIFFRMMFGIVGFGLFNGLVLLPVLFSIVGF